MAIRRRSGLTTIVLLAGTALLAGQEPQRPVSALPLQAPQFKTAVEYVEVDVLVTDESGALVRDLTVDDFAVFEDGQLQTIATFSLVDIPVERADGLAEGSPVLDPDVASNERPFGGRVYVMILDDLHVDATRTDLVKRAAYQFIDRNLGANDLMAVIQTGGRGSAGQEFTSNKRLLRAAVDSFIGRKLPSATIERNTAYFRSLALPSNAQQRYIVDPFEAERAHNAQSTLELLYKTASWFSGVRGRRKAILYLSEGIDYDISDVVRNSAAPAAAPPSAALDIADAIRTAVAATARSNVSVYSIDPRGLTGLGEDTISAQDFADAHAKVRDDLGQPVAATRAAGIGVNAMLNELRLSQNNLRDIADETNGFAIINRNDFHGAFDRIVRDNSSYYVLAYYPPAARRENRFHDIDVRVTRPGLTVRARKGYVSTHAGAPPTRIRGVTPRLADAMDSPLPVSGLGMRAFTASFRGPGTRASVLLGIELVGRDLALTDNGKVELSYVAVDTSGRTFGLRNDAVTLNLRPDTRTRVRQTGLRTLNRLDLPPGRYQLRAASYDATSGAVGSVVHDLEVPDFTRDPLSLSGLVLTSVFGSMMPTARPDESLREALPAAPAALRTFPQNDEVAFFAEVYSSDVAMGQTIDVVSRIRSDEGVTHFEHTQQFNPPQARGNRRAHPYTVRVPLGGLRPGAYVFALDARSSLGHTATRELRFWITLPAAPAF